MKSMRTEFISVINLKSKAPGKLEKSWNHRLMMLVTRMKGGYSDYIGNCIFNCDLEGGLCRYCYEP